MQFLAYLAVMIVGSLIAYALAPKPPKQKPPTLDDFDLPTAEEGRSIPWIFGTYKITDPNIIWYGDLEVRTKTKNRVKTRIYRMGIHLECCIGPVDALVQLHYGGKSCWATEVTSSQQIFIDEYYLFGGRDGEGGIEGYFDICMGEPTQAVNDYLAAQLGTPLSAFRDSLTIVGRKPNLVANSTFIKPLHPTVRCINEGWADGACWYPETASVPDEYSAGTTDYDIAASVVNSGSGLHYRWRLNTAFATNGATEANVGTAGTMPIEREATTYGTSITVQGLADGVLCGGSDYAVIFGQYANSVHRPQLTARYFLDGSEAFTIGVWFAVHPDENSKNHTLISTNVDTPSPNNDYQGLWLRLCDNRALLLQYGDGDGNGWNSRVSFYSPAGTVPDDDQAHFYVLRWNPLALLADERLAVFVDGEQVSFTRPAGEIGGGADSIGWSGGGTDPRIGFGEGFDEQAPWGYFQEAFLHLASMTAEDIATLYGAGTCAGVVGTWWDMNPAHMIYKVLTDTDQGLAEPSATIDDASFRAAALTLYTEGIGLSTQWRNEGTIRDFLSEVCTHAGAVLTLDPQTGLTQIVLLRDDYDASTLELLDDDQVIEVVEWQDAADGETVNEVTVEFRERDGSTGSVTWPNRASIQQLGRIHQTMSFPMISRRNLALRVAKRECLQRSSDLSRGKIRVNRLGWDKLPGAVFRFAHAGEGIDEVVVRVIDIDLGTLTDGAITINVVQDIFSLGDNLTDIGEQDSDWQAPDTDPAAATAQAVIEAPYWQLIGDIGAAETAALGNGAGYLIALAGKPTGVSTGFDAWARISPADYAEALADNVFAPTATLTAALDRQTDSSIALTGGVDLDLVEAGWIAMVGAGASAELCYVSALDTTTTEATLLRGRLDTTPQEHAAGTRVWFLPDAPTDWPRLPTQWDDGDAVDAKFLPATQGGVLPIASATATSATLDSRQVRPYAPGNIEINGEYHPTLLEGALSVTWSHRDRIVQGTAHVSQYDATDYGPEAGTTYSAYAYDNDTDALLDSDTGIAGTSWAPTITGSCTLRIEIESTRAGYSSWQRQVRTFDYLSDNARVTVSGDARTSIDNTTRDTAG